MHAQTAPESETSPQGLAAKVVALRGSEACLWFPSTNESMWVDLSEIGFEPMSASGDPADGQG